MTTFVIEEFVAVERGTTLRGFVRVRTPSGFVFHDVSIHQRNGAQWASPGARPRLDRSGQHMRDGAGKLLWNPVVSFASREIQDRFSNAVLEALKMSHPEVLA
jgi:hypothetical protein